eukprot:3985842-Pyramimonas_sp.AAC.1
MYIRYESASRASHKAIVVPLDDADMKRSLTGPLGAPQNDLQGIRQYRSLTCLPTNAGPYLALDDPAVKGGE